MAINVRCLECGKRARFASDEAGHAAVCAACGTAFTVPGTPTAKHAPMGSAVSPPAVIPAPVVPPGVDPARPATASPSRSGMGLGGWLLIFFGGSVAASLCGALVYTTIHDQSLRDARATATAMKADADARASRGELDAARSRYRELAAYLAAHEPQDPVLRKLADASRADQDRLDRALVARGVAAAALAGNAQPSQRQETAAPRHAAILTTAPVGTDATVAASPDTRPSPPSDAAASDRPPAYALVATAGQPQATPAAPTPPPATAPSAQPVPAAPAAVAAPGRPPIRTVAEIGEDLTDEQVGRAIQRGVDFLIEQFDPKTFELAGGRGGGGGGVEDAIDALVNGGAPKRKHRDGYHDGADALCVYALLQCGEAINDPRLSLKGPFMIGCVEAMKRFPMDEQAGEVTYGRGIRSTALALFNRKEDHEALKADVAWLLGAHSKGAYTYGKSNGNWDNSNSQYGLLGVWSGAEAEVEVPTVYWQEVEKHWAQCQEANGQWGYNGRSSGGGRLTMTCAGIASMFVTHDWLDAPRFGASVGREPFSPPLKRGLDWMEQGDHSVAISRGGGGVHWGYALYGIERVGLASGFKFFGRHNWYPELSRIVIDAQGRNGSWGDDVGTAYALLFLSRGRHPVLMNKLRYEGHWANRPRDVANLARYASKQLERPVNWQVVPIAREWTDWLDSPVLYLASHDAPKLSTAEVAKIRQYVEAGGMLFVQADGDAPAMTGYAKDLAHQLFPAYEMADVPQGHPLLSSLYKLEQHPPLKMVTNGSRILMLFSPTDIARRWQLREQRTPVGKPVFQLGMNMFVYAAGKRDLRNRLESNYIPAIAAAPSLTVKVARVRYAGNWDPEPYAWTRFGRWFQQGTGYAIDAQPVAMSALDAKETPFAHLTGTASYVPTTEEVEGVKRYVESGGVLLIDLTGGTEAFDEAIRTTLLARAFPASTVPRLIQPLHPLLQPTGTGMDDLSHARLRPYAVERIGNPTGGLLTEIRAGQGHVLVTSFDVTSGLLNTNTWGIVGFEPPYAQALMKNAILWTLDGQRDE